MTIFLGDRDLIDDLSYLTHLADLSNVIYGNLNFNSFYNFYYNASDFYKFRPYCIRDFLPKIWQSFSQKLFLINWSVDCAGLCNTYIVWKLASFALLFFYYSSTKRCFCLSTIMCLIIQILVSMHFFHNLWLL